MTRQVADTVEIDGCLFELQGTPLLRKRDDPWSDWPRFHGLESNNRKGCFSKWAIMDNALFLIAFEGIVAREEECQRPCDKEGNFTVIGLKELHGTEQPVRADWFTGTLRYSERPRYLDEVVSEVRCLTVVCGEVHR
jgi:hypothetical protein